MARNGLLFRPTSKAVEAIINLSFRVSLKGQRKVFGSNIRESEWALALVAHVAVLVPDEPQEMEADG